VAPLAGEVTVITPAANPDTGTQKINPKVNSPEISRRLQALRSSNIKTLAADHLHFTSHFGQSCCSKLMARVERESWRGTWLYQAEKQS
jgi:hypothetical protein